MSRYRPRHRAGGDRDEELDEEVPVEELDELPLDDDDLDELARQGSEWFLGGGDAKLHGRPVEDSPPL